MKTQVSLTLETAQMGVCWEEGQYITSVKKRPFFVTSVIFPLAEASYRAESLAKGSDEMHPKDEVLVFNTLCGDRSAFALLVERYQGVVYRIACQKVGNHHDAEDIAQETFLKAYCKLKTLKDPITFPSWLYAITVNLCRSWQRRRKRQVEVMEFAEAAPLAKTAWQLHGRQDQKTRLWDSINELAFKDKKIMTMFYREGYSTKEIGEEMGITQNQVLVRLHRTRKQLREEFIMAHKTYAIGEMQPAFIEQVMEQINHLKPTPTLSGERLVPWLATTALVVIAMIAGFGVMRIPWSQPSYSLTGEESTVRVRLTEAPVLKIPVLKQTISRSIGPSGNNSYGNSSGESALALAGNSQQGELHTNSKIAFASDRENQPYSDIFVMDVNGRNVIQLTDSRANDEWPSWSPDGRKIAFTSDRDGNEEIYVMNADGTDEVNLTKNSAEDVLSSWSPDGKRIVFTSTRDVNWEVYVMDSDGANQVSLTNNPADDGNPAWSPDGKRIAFYSKRDGNFDIYIMNADGTGQVNLTNNPATDSRPSWSPDSKKIAFASNRDGNQEIYVMNADGTNPMNLTKNPAGDHLPSWSPDGKKITFFSDREYREHNYEIYIMNADGINQNRLTFDLVEIYDTDPAWSPWLNSIQD